MVAEFGWSVKAVRTARELAQADSNENLVAVLFEPETLSLTWDGALRVICEATSRALPILCHRFAETIDWPQLAEAGVFHSLLLPLSQREVRQSLGFVWGAKRSSLAISISSGPDPKETIRERARGAGGRAVAMVA